MKKRQKRKLYKEHLISLANDGREFKSERAKEQWIKDTYSGLGTLFTKYYLKGQPKSPFGKIVDLFDLT